MMLRNMDHMTCTGVIILKGAYHHTKALKQTKSCLKSHIANMKLVLHIGLQGNLCQRE